MSADAIPLTDIGHQSQGLEAQLQQAVNRVMASGRYVLGAETEAFESAVASFLGADHGIGVNSGTDALVLSLKGLGIGPGDEVITSPLTYFATAEAISLAGATPVFADIDPVTYNLDPEQAAERITPRTRALLPVHLYGLPADMEALTALAHEHGLALVEDAAQAFGAVYDDDRVGTFGDAAAFSFYPSKNLGACGDAGLLVTHDADLAARCRRLRNHAQVRLGDHSEIGLNSRLDELQAAILSVRLPHLDGWNAERRRAAGIYDTRLEGLGGLAPPAPSTRGRHIYHQYTVRIPHGRRDAAQRALSEAGIGSAIYYPESLNRLPIFAGGAACPEAERAAGEVLSLPMFPGLDEARIERVAGTLAQACQ